MKLKINIENCRKSVMLEWRMPDSAYLSSIYIMPEELTPSGYPHVVRDCGRLVAFWGDKLTVTESPGNYHTGDSGCFKADTDVIVVNTHRLLEVLRKVHASAELRKDRTKALNIEIDTERLHRHIEAPKLTICQMVKHVNMAGAESFGKTLKYFKERLHGGRRSFEDLLLELSRLIQQAKIYCHRDEFYFDGRSMPGGLGFNGGIILHENTFGIHT